MPTSNQMLDQLLAEQKAGTYVDPLASAQAWLAKTNRPGNVVNDVNREVGDKSAAAAQANRYTYGNAARDIALEATLPVGAFMSGPVGAVSGGALALRSLQDFIKDPSIMSGGMAALGALPFMKGAKSLRGLKGAAGDVAKEFEVLNGMNQFDDVAGRMPKAEPVPHTFDMTGGSGRFSTNTAPADAVDAGRLTGRSQSLTDALEDPMFAMAGKTSPEQKAIDALRQATSFTPPVADPATSAWIRSGRNVLPHVNDFTTQVPEMAQAGETVAAPGFGLGPVTPLDQVPTSKAAMAAMKRAAKKGKPRLPTTNEGEVGGFSDLPELSPEEAARIAANIKKVTGR